MADVRERASPEVLIERIVRDAGLPGARERDALRRELADHFEDAAAAGAADPLARFGDADDIAAGFRCAYRRGRRTLYVAKVLASALVATLVALALQLPLHLERSADTIAIAPLYALAARISIATVLAAIAAWELDVEWLCNRLERDPVRLVATCFVLFAVLSAAHATLGMGVTPLRALLGSVTMVAVWTSSLAILSRSDRVFLRLMGGTVM